ncbi:ABC transporter ATP-binding protein [Hyphomicrobium sp.]|uniref:ABC transporter ATP-binding protein n=1 Tax=Hyphomicrobium sp. TaxID=82 RepID=UPI0025B9071E|nr:ABC transporter ATP-binding protein [Hyphomicrobium sp.]MCC7250626.1 ABC transporter ATP-binding protein [Hyphomicrobium sp.]
MIRVEQLCVMRNRKRLLDDVSFSLRRGEIVALLGPNGAGKSTLVTALSGLCRSTHGSVEVMGRPIAAYGARERAHLLAYVAQQQDFIWDLEVRDIVRLGARSLSDADATLAKLGLVELAERRIKSLSGGERARVMLARALAANTPFLLADEPAANLDIKHQRRAMRLLCDAARERDTGVLVVLHDLNLAFAFAERVLLMHQARLVLDGAAAAVAASPDLDRVFGERFTRATIDDRTVVFPTGDAE